MVDWKKQRWLALLLFLGVVALLVLVDREPAPKLTVTFVGFTNLFSLEAVYHVSAVGRKPPSFLWRNPLWTTEYQVDSDFELGAGKNLPRRTSIHSGYFDSAALGGVDILCPVSPDDGSVRITKVVSSLKYTWNTKLHLPFRSKQWVFDLPPAVDLPPAASVP